MRISSGSLVMNRDRRVCSDGSPRILRKISLRLVPARVDSVEAHSDSEKLMAKKAQAARTAPKKKATPKAAATSPVVTLKHIAAQMAETHELPTNRAVAMLNDTVDLLSKHLVKGSKVRIVGLGIFQVKRRQARMGRNPRTGRASQDKGQQEGHIPPGQGIEGSCLRRPIRGLAALCQCTKGIPTPGRNTRARHGVSA